LKVELWEGGLLAHELEAIEKIEQHFSVKAPKVAPNKEKLQGSLQDQLVSLGLKKTANEHCMFPWKGYAGFRLVENGKEGEFDLLIVTHCNVIIVELKDWNHGKITCRGNKWYLGNKDMGKSPVEVTRNKKYLIEKKLQKYKNRFTNKGYNPFVHFVVVMTGDADISQLNEVQRGHTMSLDEFLKIDNEQLFDRRFTSPKTPKAKQLNKDFYLFDELFDRNLLPPKQISINGYSSTEEIFEHPDKVYKEFEAVSESTSKDTALMRLWNFDNMQSVKAQTDAGRYEIVSREREVLNFIKNSNLDLYNHCLNSLVAIQKEQINAQYTELYELKPGHLRFNEFVGKFVTNFTESDRVKLVKLLVSKFADLHEAKIAHRDIGDHSIWLSPSKDVALSSFISAYHQPQGTVGDHRGILSVVGVAPFGMTTNKKTTPYQIDVYTLGVMAWHILNATRISKKNSESFTDEAERSEHWYAGIIRNALSQNYTNAGEMFNALTEAEPKNEINLDFDIALLDPYKRPIKIDRQYPEDVDGLISESDEKEVYRSNGMLVKSWLGIQASNDKPQLGYQLLQFLERVSQLKSIAPPYLPRIYEFGLARSSALFMVSDIVKGEHLSAVPSGEHNLVLVKKLIAAVEHLHSLHIAHGDLHPENVSVNVETEALMLIDIPDFCLAYGDVKNHKYSPENIDSCTAYERDNFAVMRMSLELLGLEWAQPSDIRNEIAEVVQTELNDSDYGFKSLERFRHALNASDNEVEFIDISVRGDFETLEIFPDNGSLYVNVAKNDRDSSQVKVELFGVGGSITLIFIPDKERFKLGFPPRIQSDVSRRQRDKSKFEVSFGLRVSSTEYSNLSELEPRLVELEGFQRAVSLALIDPSKFAVSAPNNSLPDAGSKSTTELNTGNDNSTTNDIKPIGITTKELWEKILETETESHPYVELTTEAEPVAKEYDQVILNHDSESDPLASFKNNDVIEVVKIQGEAERTIGIVDLKKSDLKEVRLIKISQAAKSLNEGEVVFFRTKADKASYEKRKDALERILEKESTITELVEYFEPESVKLPIEYNIEVSDSDFSRYDRIDDHGNEISLNSQQRQAFQQLLNNGPLSLLQGPPGTGKTEFIAAFVHYLVEKQGAERILMVSQSHEAVNTAAERVRKHCLRLKTPLDVVRFSNRDNNVSDGLKDVYSQSLIDERRALFIAESSSRISGLSQSLGLDKAFLVDASKLELTVIRQVDNLIALQASIDAKGTNEDDVVGFKKTYNILYEHVRSQAQMLMSFDISSSPLNELPTKLWSCLTSSYAVTPKESVRAKALCKISRDMLEVLESERVNYDEFFARSRQLVTGTCVGIGQRHIGISQNQYDWVIIDEAARSIASELAIAMQVGKRILLVGDHHQLPPLYTTPHKKALARKLGIVSNDIDLDELLQSDFARAFESEYGKKTGAKLLTQYRMAEPIGSLVSDCFYKGELKTGSREIPNIYQGLPKATRNFVSWLDTSTLGKAAHHQKDPKGSSIANNAEVDSIIKLLKQMESNESLLKSLRCVVDDNEPAIGVICMYAEQKKRLRRKFVEQHWDEAFKSLVRIDTVDSYQGKENRIVIVSITRSIGDQSTGFLRSPNRINVAISRAMDRLIIVGNTDMWRGKNHAMPLGRVLEYVEERCVVKDGRYAIVDAKKLTMVSK
jgi:serine/threonine protein kinase